MMHVCSEISVQCQEASFLTPERAYKTQEQGEPVVDGERDRSREQQELIH